MPMHATCLTAEFETSMARRARVPADRERDSRRAFLAVVGLLLIVSAAATVFWCNSMESMGGMQMPGGWTMSMTWMRMPGQTWAGATGSFLVMWIVMMVAMMLPSVAPMLLRYRESLERTQQVNQGRLTTVVGLGYFFVWTLFGLVIFAVGAPIAAIEMERPALAQLVPVTSGFALLLAGAVQFTRWKAHHLACCREAPGHNRTLPADKSKAFRMGTHLGVHCGLSCANLTAILLVFGVMDLRVMALVTAAITAERLLPAHRHIMSAVGAAIVITGILLVAKALRHS